MKHIRDGVEIKGRKRIGKRQRRRLRRMGTTVHKELERKAFQKRLKWERMTTWTVKVINEFASL